jgi:hypothetical protein
MREALKTTSTMVLEFTPIQQEEYMKQDTEITAMRVIGKMARDQEQENWSRRTLVWDSGIRVLSNLKRNMREALKMTFTMDLAFTPIKTEIQQTTM